MYSEDAAEMLAEFIRMKGHETCIALTGSDGARMAEAFAPDLVLLDIGLPVVDGYEVAARLQKLPALADARLVAMTGYGQARSRENKASGFPPAHGQAG